MSDVRYAKFRVGDLFEKLSAAYYGDGVRHSDISDVWTEEYCVPVTSAKSGDNGICRWAREGQFETYSSVLSIVYNGAIAAGLVYYQPGPVSFLVDSYFIRLKHGDLNEQLGLYLACALQKVTKSKYSRDNKAVWKRVSKDFIELPVTPAGMPDWDYMVEYIAELEAERIAELEAYLVATGLDDCELTDEDCEVLGRDVETKEFLVGDLFDVCTTKSTDRKNVVFDDSGKYEFVGRSKANNCVQGRVSKFGFDANSEGTLSVVQIGDICCTYRNEPWYASQNIFCLKPVVELDELSALYMATCINKALAQFEGGYVSYPTKKSLQQLGCVVPVTPSGTPDWDYMRAYIRAQEKLVMASVADMTQERIDATREIVGA